MKIIRHIMLCAIIFALASCEKEIDFEYKRIPQQQVIEGLLTQDSLCVRLTHTVATDEPFSESTITDATVRVVDKTNGAVFVLAPNNRGEFTVEGLSGQSGHEYELTVDIGADTYVCASRMQPASEIVSAQFNWIKMPYDDVAVLKVEFTEVEEATTNYWLRVYRNGEPYEWQTISSHNAVDGIVSGLMLTSRKDIDKEDDDEILREGDVVDIEVMPVTKDMGDYLNSLNRGDYNGNQMFAGSYCLGYFLAAPMSRTRLVYHPDQIPYAK